MAATSPPIRKHVPAFATHKASTAPVKRARAPKPLTKPHAIADQHVGQFAAAFVSAAESIRPNLDDMSRAISTGVASAGMAALPGLDDWQHTLADHLRPVMLKIMLARGREVSAGFAEVPPPVPVYEVAKAEVTVAGLAVIAGDSGRVLMLQRSSDPDDPAHGTWEFPGGHLEPGEPAMLGAMREWAEEVGQRVPPGVCTGSWRSPNGIYETFVWQIGAERDLTINAGEGRVLNPDDPDGDGIEVVAWWKVTDLPGMAALRSEVQLGTNWSMLRVAIAKAAGAGGDGQIGMAFDLTNPYALTAARYAIGELVTNISASTRVAIQDAIRQSIEQGIPPRSAAKGIQAMVGLNGPQSRALANYRQSLATQGVNAARADKLSSQYGARLLKQRGEMIARTETIRASTLGTQASWAEAIKAGNLDDKLYGQVWVDTGDERECQECMDLASDDPVPFGQPFGGGDIIGPPAHTDCRCDVGIALLPPGVIDTIAPAAQDGLDDSEDVTPWQAFGPDALGPDAMSSTS